VEIFIRPESVRLQPAEAGAPEGSVSGEISETVFFGALTRVRMTLHDSPAPLHLWADMSSAEAEGFRPGRKVSALWDATAPRVMPSV
jgi:ABC-type Fe3+/spermidine/putrescine transport system ATPase subunit